MQNTMERPKEESLREEAVTRLKKRRDFGAHVLAYLMVNGFLVLVWALTGGGFFWPLFPLGGWGIGLVFHAWDTFSPGPSEERIRREIERMSR
jgi:vacuolar-type H+-ATPase subunit I/STV1